MTSVNGVVYTWDANGNLLDDGVSTYTYDHANRLTQVVDGSLTTEFTYNGLGDRVAKTVNGVATDYVLDPAAGLTQVLQDTTDGQTTSYLYGHDLLAQYDSGTWAYHVNDGLGSVRQVVDPTGQVVQSYSFDPFGVPLGESGGEPYGFTGEQWDADVELLYLRARYYDPATSRFLSRDPWPGNVWRPYTLHIYTYVQNNPAILVDPSGLQPRGLGDIGGEYGYEYSCNCGWIDWGHALPDKASQILERVKADVWEGPTEYKVVLATMEAGVRIPIIGRWIILPLVSEYAVVKKYLRGEEAKRVALGVYMELSERFEAAQGMLPFGGGTAFSEEDLPSNLIGFYIAAEGRCTKEHVKKWCRALGTEKSREIYGNYQFTKNRSWQPRLADTCEIRSYCSEPRRWPSQLSTITPEHLQRDGEWWWYEFLFDGELRPSGSPGVYALFPVEWPIFPLP